MHCPLRKIERISSPNISKILTFEHRPLVLYNYNRCFLSTRDWLAWSAYFRFLGFTCPNGPSRSTSANERPKKSYFSLISVRAILDCELSLIESGQQTRVTRDSEDTRQPSVCACIFVVVLSPKFETTWSLKVCYSWWFIFLPRSSRPFVGRSRFLSCMMFEFAEAVLEVPPLVRRHKVMHQFD